MGFSAKLLAEAAELDSFMGQVTVTAAVIDDVLSLILLAEVQALGAEDVKTLDYVLPLVGSFGE